ncbi:hypothetical protein [Lactobacillus kefiranofaciens]|uniref:hypothetical protein n=1 Tax=Lactobacillus kefiranofaciens TaxID=267818 RepID=UPI003312FE29
MKGLKKINGYWYLFNKNGVMLKDVRKIPHTKHYSYFDYLGKEDFMKYLSRNQAEQWLNQHTLYGKKRKMFNNKFLSGTKQYVSFSF